MKAEDLEIGKVYVVAGQGPMVAEAMPREEGCSVTFRRPNGNTYYASLSQVVRVADREYLGNYLVQGSARGLFTNRSVNKLSKWLDEATVCERALEKGSSQGLKEKQP